MAMEEDQSLVDSFGDVGVVKTMRFEEFEHRFGSFEGSFFLAIRESRF